MSATPPLRPWDHLRAALIVVHVLAVVGMSLPSPEGLTEDQLTRGAGGAQVKRWAKALGHVGMSGEATMALILDGGRALEWAEDRAERIFAPYARYAGVKQSWRMFSSSGARGSRIEMWLREGGTWRPLYVTLDPEARWRADLWEDGRVRGAIKTLAAERFERWWTALARSAARRAAADFPDAEAFRLQRVPLRFPTPEQLAAGARVEEREPVGRVDVELTPLREAR